LCEAGKPNVDPEQAHSTRPAGLTGRARWLAFLPKNRWRLPNADAHVRHTGPCGDTMEFWITLRDGRVEKATFDADGCDATLACGSAVTLLACGLTVEQASHVNQRAVLQYLGGLPEAFEHCALLAATTFQMALAAARGNLQEHTESGSGG